ncbi:Uncharacterised protein [Klebsiella pneumoniae]|uniref:SD repeat-containing cell surface protein n=1 Tax=Klebsiella pneumoniae TaxID=573 RepID=A0A377WM37_KLEPN|nr:Uncharacterised protein [Klebsiella pneumoniae]
MTVSTQVSRNEYTGNGATTQYDFTFRILDKSHLLVQTLDTSESIVTLTLGTDYTVTGVNRYNGGKVVLTSALPAGYKSLSSAARRLRRKPASGTRGASFLRSTKMLSIS